MLCYIIFSKQKHVFGELIISFSGDNRNICSILVVVLYFLGKNSIGLKILDF